ncbi:hypothetical protein [Bacillus sp. ISL-47]|uniref:hypothetical protein n=1 Tax=Bacillus sp. ISL-47 TaxID=2819130 RepID=UPI001BEC727D|nr:hypothetical protein [Bacillus sp. ISL-47]MBT2710498.1 hypothetical protein [Pseudomonas sp. ISL-84]
MDEDQLLAEVVLGYIRKGGTQLQAFKKVGKQLSRTSAACGFRWNAKVRKNYCMEIESAKQYKKEKESRFSIKKNQKTSIKVQVPSYPKGIEESALELEQVLSSIKNLYEVAQSSQKANNHSEESIQKLSRKILLLEKENKEIAAKKEKIEEEYLALKKLIVCYWG